MIDTRRSGAELAPGGGVVFRLWAPSVARASVAIESSEARGLHPMARDADGWHAAHVAAARAGTRYRFAVGGGLRVPDPASRHNPDDAHGASTVVDPQGYRWADTGWRGRPWHEAVLYELHVGTFTPEGTFAAAAARLPELAALGITALQLMPVAEFAGARNWGYDGVLPFAPESSYGTPDELKALVDAAHGLNLMVLLDVVYNHFGPDGNYLHAYCPEFFDAACATPWGPAINFDGAHSDVVRRFFVDNALHWVETFHVDGLRLDAVHQIHDRSPTHLVSEIAAALRCGPGRERHVHLVLENDANEAHRLERGADAVPLHATAQWNDDLHHAAHTLLTGEADGYYRDFVDAPDAQLARAFAQGFVYQGQHSPHRAAKHGSPSAHLPPLAFVSFLQNHDQIGNRAHGERLDALADAPRVEALLACLLLAPQVPMLFMGEEFAASTPFLYFCDFKGELGAAVARGRRAEFGRFKAFADEAARAAIADPNDPATFARSTLKWAEREAPHHRERLALVAELLALRARHLVPRLAGPARGGTHRSDRGLLHVKWRLGDGTPWQLTANLSTAPRTATLPGGETIYARGIEPDGAGAAMLAPGAVSVVAG
ncbi:MAG TPA: malto-oligosyltrehalose trehalohydrolase [Burkholderiaceae bacterium]|nr:malto-oligosyltrehalose trehalohydrolase [Burkholderiaceae bacterium]